ncbi:MAG: ABC transporter ATP-binding protein/permease [Chloroflexota bacterium]|nr:ABC transporter ATP-binding protein/permease [Chloroflexota bacterium]
MATPTEVLRGQARGLRSSLGVLHRFRRELYPHWRALLVALLSSVGYTATRLAEPWPLKFIFDNVLAGMPLETPLPWLNDLLGSGRMRILAAASSMILALALLRGVFYYYQRYLTSRVGQEVVLNVRRQLFAHMQRLSLRYHAQSSTGDLLTRLTSDINLLRDLLVASMLSLVSEGIILAGFILVMFALEWRLALLAVVAIPVIFLLMAVYSTRIREATRNQRRREGELSSRLNQTLLGIHVVQMFAREREEDEHLRQLNSRSLASGLQTAHLEAHLNRCVELVIATGTAATLWFGATQVLAGRLTPGDLIVFLSYMQNFYRPLRQVSRVTERAQKANSCVERITDVLDERREIQDGTRRAPRFEGEISFEHVWFQYKSGTPTLRDINLTLQPGKTVAVVGASGAGKSTLLGLIPRLHDPSKGTVRIDGHDVRRFKLESLRDQISIVPQDGMLFSGDIRDNIAYGKPDATDEEIEAAARAACIHDYIMSLPQAYRTVVGERGMTLSGGQRQRLAIARAIIKDAPIVLLDEPTTGLDSESEGLVMQALERLLARRTAVVIAHRLSTIRRAHVILVMDEGQIVESGTHDELLALGGRYRSLYELQLSKEENLVEAP